MPRARPIRRPSLFFLALASLGVTCFFLGDHLRSQPPSLSGLLHLQGTWTVSVTNDLRTAAASGSSPDCLVFAPADPRFEDDPDTLFVVTTSLHVEPSYGDAEAIVLHGYTSWHAAWIDSDVRRGLVEQVRCVCPCVPNLSINGMLGGAWSRVVRPLVWPRMGRLLTWLSLLFGVAAVVPLTIVLARLGDDGPWSARRHCVRCNYDLVGLPPGSPCPECGTPRPNG